LDRNVMVELTGIKKEFNGRYALKGIDLKLFGGEIHCLAGGNGCGKSTLIKTISGVLEQTEGEVTICGKKMQHMRPITAIQEGVQVIYQDFAVFPNLSVMENIALNTEIRNRDFLVDKKRMRELALSAMEMIGVEMDPEAILDTLPVAWKQMTALCRAIINDPKVLILDEPTTALTAPEVEHLWKVLAVLRERGIAVLLVDHKFDEIRRIADRLTILRNGEFVSSGPIGEYGYRRFRKEMTGRDFEVEKYAPEPCDTEVLRVEGLTRRNAFENVSFTLYKGDVLGITGLLGSGRNEIAEALFGLSPAESGKIVLNGRELRIASVKDAVENEIGYVPEDRLTEGLFTDYTIEENISASSLKRFFKGFSLQNAEIKETAKRWIDSLSIKARSEEAPVSSLSGGNAQKVVLSKWLNTEPKLLILNGPSVGMDVGAKAEIHEILHGLAGKGIGIVMITDDLEELTDNCNRILIMRDHRVAMMTDNSMSKKNIEALLMGERPGEDAVGAAGAEEAKKEAQHEE